MSENKEIRKEFKKFQCENKEKVIEKYNNQIHSIYTDFFLFKLIRN